MNQEILRQFIVFCAVGLINTAAGLSTILILSEGLGVHYMLSNIMGYGVGLIVAFILHRRITFKLYAKDEALRHEVGKFILVFVICYLIQLACLYILVTDIGLHQAIAQVLSLGIYTVLNYLGHRYFTFHHRKQSL